MTQMKFDFCIGNAENGSETVRSYLIEHHPSIKLSKWGCLGNCADCFKRPFVILNDEKIIEGETADELLQQVKKLLEEST
jgi:uncharacterized protein YuzB (UPF0349 family)